MLKTLKSALLVPVLFSFHTSTVLADPNTVLANICTIVSSDDKSQLRKKIKTMKSDYSMKLPEYYDGISCGGLTLIRHAIKSGAVESGSFIIKKMSKKVLRSPMADGTTELDWATANGHEGSPLVAALKDRIG